MLGGHIRLQRIQADHRPGKVGANVGVTERPDNRRKAGNLEALRSQIALHKSFLDIAVDLGQQALQILQMLSTRPGCLGVREQ